MTIGVIAYGSLITDPGRELKELEAERRFGIRTPFRVEYARTSEKRGGAPTLVPVIQGGAYVDAVLIVLRPRTSIELARDVLYRREIHSVGELAKCYSPSAGNKNQVFVEVIPELFGVDHVLYTRLEPNIANLSPDTLAEKAIASARTEFGTKREDGISYLISALASGIRTPLTDAYASKILEKTSTESLEMAWQRTVESKEQSSGT